MHVDYYNLMAIETLEHLGNKEPTQVQIDLIELLLRVGFHRKSYINNSLLESIGLLIEKELGGTAGGKPSLRYAAIIKN